ncbi:ABC transporter permease [Actinophytocola sp. NPDC049390]|uniref:ABC transporter permease n=1 Tax=Actinophytocola sp. NPDC049390 TaxID=3363894 RepID=UPI0037B4C734
MTAARTVSLVARRELAARLRTRSFVFGTVLSALVLAGFVLTQSAVFDDRHRETIGLNGQAIAVSAQLVEEARQVGRDVRTVEVTDLADGRARVADGRLDALVSGAPAALTVLVSSGLDDELRGVLNGLVRQQVLRGQLAALEDPTGLDVDGLLRNVAEAHVTVRTLSSPDPHRDERHAVALVVVALLYLGFLLYGSLVAQGVVAERFGGVAEFLWPVVRPGQQLGGKVAGLGLAGLVQLLVVGAVGLLVALATKVLVSTGVAVAAFVWGLVWYLLGFLLYATVFAAVGVRVSRQEDVQAALTPVTVVLLVAFAFGFALLSQDPSGLLTVVLSLVPPLSPLIMPGRLALGAVPVWQVLLSLVATVAVIAVLVRISTRLYRKALTN